VSNMDFLCLFQNEYQVESCSTNHKEENGCVHVKRTNLPFQTGGYVIYGVAHQHSGGIGSTLYGQVICNSCNLQSFLNTW
jgi:hypothetical protein